MNKKLLLILALQASFTGLALRAQEQGHRSVSIAPESVARKYIGMAHLYELGMQKEAVLGGLADAYFRFLGNFGATESCTDTLLLESLFTLDCTKIMNGKVVAGSRAQLLEQLTNGKNAVGSWVIEPIGMRAINIAENTIVVHYNITTEKYGTFTVIKYLTVNDGKIACIDEVCAALDA